MKCCVCKEDKPVFLVDKTASMCEDCYLKCPDWLKKMMPDPPKAAETAQAQSAGEE